MMRVKGRWLTRRGALTAPVVVSLIATALAEDAKLAQGRKEGKVAWYTGAAVFTAENVARRFE